MIVRARTPARDHACEAVADDEGLRRDAHQPDESTFAVDDRGASFQIVGWRIRNPVPLIARHDEEPRPVDRPSAADGQRRCRELASDAEQGKPRRCICGQDGGVPLCSASIDDERVGYARPVDLDHRERYEYGSPVSDDDAKRSSLVRVDAHDRGRLCPGRFGHDRQHDEHRERQKKAAQGFLRRCTAVHSRHL